MLYFPTKHSEPAALEHAKDIGLEPWRDEAGALVGWRRPSVKAFARLLIFHGNAGCALDRDYYANAFGGHWEVYLFEYPGYGSRDGKPGKSAFIEAGTAAVENLLSTDSRPIFLLGESIGSGTAAAIAGAMPAKIGGVALMLPFARLEEVAKEKFPWLPVSLLLRDKFDNIGALSTYRRPIAVIVAEKDEVVGSAQGHKLYEAYAGPKKLIILPNATHNRFPSGPDAEWFREVSLFFGNK